MKVIYTAPNRAHHFSYASALLKANALKYFVSGLSRFNKYVNVGEFGKYYKRVDLVQTIFIISLRLKFPNLISSNLSYWARIEQDNACKKILSKEKCDIFLFYNGSGLNTCLTDTENNFIKIIEVVNCHVTMQERLMKDEHELLGLKWVPFHKKEKERRLKEYELANYILLPSEFVKKSFLDMGFPIKKLIKVAYGFDKTISHHPDNLKDNNSKFTVLYVGSVTVRKGIKYLIEAFENFNHPNKTLLIVGPITKPSGIENIKIPDNVVLKGVLKGKHLENAYLSANVFCLPSIEDGFGLVLGEAISYGIPIIATENTGASELITDGLEGFIIPIRDSNAIKEKLQILADDSVAYIKMKNSAKIKATTLNGWEKTKIELVNELKRVF